MTGWKKYFRPTNSVLPGQGAYGGSGKGVLNKFSSWLPEVYQGPPNRLQRYAQYDQMDFDHEVHSALDTIAEFSTHPDDDLGLPFDLEFFDDPAEHEVEILKKSLRQWCKRNQFNRRMFKIFRSAIKYGDQFFIRDPETYKLIWVDPQTVERVVINESEGKKPEIYYIKNLDLNLQLLTGTDTTKKTAGGYGSSDSIFPNAPLTGQANFKHGNAIPALTNQGTYGGAESTFPVDAIHVVHLSLTEGMDDAWPFGVSILEKAFKVYKQKELLEDAILIYRVHRAPERRVFMIDTGTMPPEKAQQYLERVRYEVQQKRIPTRSGGGENVMDSAYNPLCLDLSTEIPLLDGRTLPLSELIKEYKRGKENWVYSCDPVTGEPMPGNITWAGITRDDAECIKLTLDNGETLTCTPDHKIPVLGKGFVEAQDLTENDPLISFETRHKSLSRDPNRSYEQVYDHSTNTWKFTHRVVGEFFKNINKHQVLHFDERLVESTKDTVHHRDYNRYNNDPRNLVWMNAVDHVLYHSFNKQEYWDNITEDEAQRVKDKIRQSLYDYWDNMSDEDKDLFSQHRSVVAKKVHADKKHNDPEGHNEWITAMHNGRKEFVESGTEEASAYLKISADNLRKNKAENQTFYPSREFLTRLVELVKEHDSNRLETLDLGSNDETLISIMQRDNPFDSKSTHNLDNTKLTEKKLRKVYEEYGFDGWKDFKSKVEYYNHRVVKIEKVSNRTVGTITVDGQERWHSHHTFAIKSGIYIKNSMLEDYFFAQTSDGRGSSVTTLEGGQNLGEIDDLKYFNNKMLRALGIPSSYLPTGPDDGTAQFNDGKVGSAFIQEFRFTRYCKRLQRQLIDPLDREFKLFLKHRGINIDAGLFELTFTQPQNFQEYRQIEIDAAFASVYGQLAGTPYISKRYLLKRYLGWSEDEIIENEALVLEETKGVGSGGSDQSGDASLRHVGVSPNTFDDFSDIDTMDDMGDEGLGDIGDMGDMAADDTLGEL
jgi:hypothetical protein